MTESSRVAAAPRASERQLIQALTQHGPMTRQQLSERTGLPLSTVTGAAKRLIAKGLVHPAPDEPSPDRRGRPTTTLALAPATGSVVGFVVYGDELGAGVVTSAGGLAAQTWRSVPDWRHRDMTSEARSLIDELLAEHGRPEVTRLVVGLPFPYQPGLGHQPLQPDHRRAERWATADVAIELAGATGLATFADNSCRLTTLAEHAFGAARGHDHVIYVQLVGGGSNAGVIAGGALLRGAAGLAGEISHLHMSADGPFCPCGARGCLGVTIEQPDLLVDALRVTHPEITDIHQLLGLAAQGTPGLRRALHDLGELFGRHLAAGCIMLNPDLLVVDGALGPAAAPVIAGLREGLRRHLPVAVYTTMDIVAGKFGREGALIGAAAVPTTTTFSEPKQAVAAIV